MRKREKWKPISFLGSSAVNRVPTELTDNEGKTGHCNKKNVSGSNESVARGVHRTISWNAFHLFCVWFLVLGLVLPVMGLPPVIRIGALFTEEQKDTSVELAFKYAVYRLNKDRSVLPNTTLVYDIQYVPKDDSFRTSKKACRQISYGVQAIFGPADPILGPHIQSICDALDIPHMEARLDVGPADIGAQYAASKHYPNSRALSASLSSGGREFSINLHPSQLEMNRSFKDLMRFLNWTKVAIIYEDDTGLVKLQELVRDPPTRNGEVYIRQAMPSTYRHILREFKQRDFYNVIVDTRSENMPQFFRAILQLQMNDYRYHYLFTTLDIETLDLEDFKYNGVNITAFRIVDAEHPKTKASLRDMQKFQPIGHSILHRNEFIQAEPALVFDSVMALAQGLAALDSGTALRMANISCEEELPWTDGASLFNYINSVNFQGLTGPVRFTEGRRAHFRMDLLRLRKEHLQKVGEWSPQGGVNITDKSVFYEGSAPNITLIAMFNEDMPYVAIRHDKNLTGNDRYEGFSIDLLKAIAPIVGFNYHITIVPDRRYGVLDPETGEWNGIVRQLMEKKADLAIGSMTINYAREHVIDFTKPFMNLGISILFKKPNSQPTRLFSFMNPLAMEIWLYVLAAYVLVSFTLFVMARFSPYEWSSPHPCLEENGIMENQFSISNSFWFITGTLLRQGSGLNPKVPQSAPTRLFSFMNPLGMEIWFFVLVAYVLVSLTLWVVARFTPNEWKNPHLCPCTIGHDVVQNDFSLGNSFWFTVGTLMQQGSDINPKATSTRIVGGIWWFFTLIIISSYTANLAAFLTVERMITPIQSAEDLAAQTDILYGTLEAGSTMTFFRDSKIETYQKMWRFMESKKPSVFVTSYEEGVRRVLEGNFAYLMESTTLEYIVQRNCNLTQVGGLLNSNSYGIAMPKGSPWRDKISLAILELQEKGAIQLLYNKWWKNTGDVCNRDEKSKESKASALGVENIGGVFVVLLCGLALAILVAILEFCWNSRRNAQTDRQSLCSEMAEELRFALRCHGSRQRPALRRTCTRCSPPNNTYVPSGHDIPPIPPLHGENGSILPMVELRKSNLMVGYDVDS